MSKSEVLPANRTMPPNRVAREVALPGPHNTPHAGPHGAFHEEEEREILPPQGWRYDPTPSGLFPWRGYLLRVAQRSSLFLRVWSFTLSPALPRAFGYYDQS